jgi:hypothetical protein
MVTLINEDILSGVGANNERKFVFIIDMCALVKSRKSLDDFYVVHPTSCRRRFPLSQQIFKMFSLLTRNNFPHVKRFSPFFPRERVYVRVEKFVGNFPTRT